MEAKSVPATQETPSDSRSNLQVALLEVVKRTDIDPERLEKFLDLQIKMEERQAKAAFQEALAGFQGDCPIIPKTKSVDFQSKSGNRTKYNYSPLDEIVHIIRPFLKRWGLSYSFDIEKTESQDERRLVTTIYHTAGHSAKSTYYFNPLHDDQRMNQSQRAKSSVTFAKRAGLENALGLVTAEEDDDAARAVDRAAGPSQLDTIRELIKETNTDEQKLLQFLKAESLETLSDFAAQKAIHALKQKRGR